MLQFHLTSKIEFVTMVYFLYNLSTYIHGEKWSMNGALNRYTLNLFIKVVDLIANLRTNDNNVLKLRNYTNEYVIPEEYSKLFTKIKRKYWWNFYPLEYLI